jgi:hypothetical protein
MVVAVSRKAILIKSISGEVQTFDFDQGRYRTGQL